MCLAGKMGAEELADATRGGATPDDSDVNNAQIKQSQGRVEKTN